MLLVCIGTDSDINPSIGGTLVYWYGVLLLVCAVLALIVIPIPVLVEHWYTGMVCYWSAQALIVISIPVLMEHWYTGRVCCYWSVQYWH